jgi:hypothetical protein
MSDLKKALSDLKEYGAEIQEVIIKDTKFHQVKDTGIWGFCSSEPDMVLDDDEIIELAEMYCE